MRDESWLQAHEYKFAVGCNFVPFLDETLPPESICYRSLRVAAFDPPYLVSVLQVGHMAEVRFIAEVSCSESTEDINVGPRWLRAVASAFENKTELPTEIPSSFCFAQAKDDLTSIQVDWLRNQMERIQPLNLKTIEESGQSRDGQYYFGGIKINGQHANTVCLRNGDDDHRQSQFHRTLFELAVSSITESQSAEILRNMRPNFT